ncbi:NADH-quinone oxidoreductase subunit K [Pedococcus dokdonensis]|uniref:NADH-quinone oxidoreductase subunit K n=1 Tax=Pedococcus dokdonensis TaxID=443156 RepID=A0A1H0V4P5_9MICO|nr:NADH-quinone oxidoreductase subunit NuoK [Pedococcus dokdonensis]SDP73076.1 NADH-quinone oxidoreductase subunit K [Pedococcus dokdonensis]
MIHLAGPYLLAAVLAGLGTYGVLARRNAVLVLIGVELILNAANLLLVSVAASAGDRWAAGNVLTLFVITIAAAEVVVALAVVLAVYRLRGDVDLSERAETGAPTEAEHGVAGEVRS